MVAGRERQLAAQTDAARHQAKRPLRCDMNIVRRHRVDFIRHLPPHRQRQPDVGIEGQREGRKTLWRQEMNGNALFLQGSGEFIQRTHDAVDLRVPGIGDNENGFFHRSPRRGFATGRGAPADLESGGGCIFPL